MSRLHEVLVAVDQLANAILGGYADETISARSWRLRARRPYAWMRPLIDQLFFWQTDHCKTAYESEWARSQLPAEYRDTNPPSPLKRVFLRPDVTDGRSE